MKLLILFMCALSVLTAVSFAATSPWIKGTTYYTMLNLTETYAVGVPISVSVVCPVWANSVENSCTGSTMTQGASRAPTRSLVGNNCTATFAGYTATATEAGFVYGPGVTIMAVQRCLNITA